MTRSDDNCIFIALILYERDLERLDLYKEFDLYFSDFIDRVIKVHITSDSIHNVGIFIAPKMKY